MNFPKGEFDFYTTLQKAFDDIDSNWMSYTGLLIAGSHEPTDVERKIELIRQARLTHTPFLGICLGMQLMAIEWARNVKGLENANSTEIDRGTRYPVVVKLQERVVGRQPVVWFDGETTLESHWNGYVVNPYYYPYFQDLDVSLGANGIEIMKLKDHSFFWGVQWHPEYQSSKDKPHHLLVNFIEACKKASNKNTVVGGARLSEN